MTALEQDLQATLFERSTTGVNLTEAGRTLLGHAERMESEMLQAEADLRQQDIHLAGTVRIGAPDGFTTYFLVPTLKELVERHPKLDIQLVPMPLAVSLARRDVDIAITIEEPEAGRIVARKLTEYSLGIFGARDYLARHGRPTVAEDLDQHRLIGYVESYAFPSAMTYVGELFGGRRTAFECASAVGQVEAVRAGLGLAFCTISSPPRCRMSSPSCRSAMPVGPIGCRSMRMSALSVVFVPSSITLRHRPRRDAVHFSPPARRFCLRKPRAIAMLAIGLTNFAFPPECPDG